MSRTNTCIKCGEELDGLGHTTKPDGNRICYPECNMVEREYIEGMPYLFDPASSAVEIQITVEQAANINNKLIEYLHEANFNGMRRKDMIERFTQEYKVPLDINDAILWRVIKRYINKHPEIMFAGNKRGTTYYLKVYFESTEISELTIPMMKKIMDTYPENARFEKKSILDLFSSKTPEKMKGGDSGTKYYAQPNPPSAIENNIAYLLKINQLFKEGTGRGTRYFWSNDENPFQETGPRERISVKLPAKMSRWLRAKSGDGGEYRSQGEVIEQAMWDKYGKEISAWSDNFPF